MTETLTALILDAATGEEIIRPLTEKEITEHQEMQAAQEAIQAEQDAKIAARQSALAKLAALGLTEEEIGAL
jgi:DNA-binding NarL/FixJ family response regulator